MGYEVSAQDVSLTQPTNIAGTITKNVIALKRATKKTDLTVYVTAHIDTMGSTTRGANDNGSGVVGMLAIARALKDVKTNYNVCFVSFCAEEYGCQGSIAFCNNLTENERANAIADYNLDMIATSYPACRWRTDRSL